MKGKPQVLLLGDSVFMDSVAESLFERKSSYVFRICSKAREARRFINLLNPDLIIYELNAQNTDPVFAIIKEQADTLHLAIDLDYNQIILFDCQRKQAGSMQDLCELVLNEVNLKNKKVGKEVV